jgi:phosphatidylserine decarboxylase
MRIHKEGYSTIAIVFISLAILLSVSHYLIPFAGITKFILMLVDISALVLMFLVVYFFRYPLLKVQKNSNLVISPADGIVVVIEKTDEKEFLLEKRVQVSIFMSPLNTHMNRYPISGKLIYHQYHKGKFLVAWDPKSSTDNERNTMVIENSSAKILIRQIAGALARRIRWYGKIGDQVEQGDQLGFIKFGSRVDLFLPLDAEINVSLNEKVFAGISTIAKLK